MRSVPPPAASSPALILLVDDNPHGMLARDAVLRSLGYEVAVASSAEQALELAAGREFDLVVTDFRMPEMDGKELISALRARGFSKPIILLSGFAEKLGFNEQSTGADLVIQKSANEAGTLVNGVKRLLGTGKKPASASSNEARKRAAHAE